MKAKLTAALTAGMAVLLAPAVGWAEGPAEIYPEQRADGQVYTVGRWGDGTYATALRDYPEARPDGTQVYVYVWDNGTQSVLLREYAEADADGVWTVRAWEDGSYTRAQASPPPPPQGPLQAQAGPLKPIPKPAPLDAAVRNAAWFATVSVVVPAGSGGYSQGTGIVVQTSTEGFDLLTAHHVVAGRREDEPMRVGPFGGWIQTAVVVATAPRQDLALLRVASDVRVYGAALLGDSDAVGVGDAVYVLSYPA
ncbi:MAG: trypsin-like peptidase domain-containing protein, partial [Chloroflexi bacterium]|nr:trypsin-like peptidase domain-containing protein [Chloroflexota bacterium]